MQAVETVLGEGSLVIDPDQLGALAVRKGICLAVIQLTRIPDMLIVSLRASCSPNVSALIVSSLNAASFKIELDPNFEFDDNGEMLLGREATRYFIDNAKLIMYGEREPSKDSTVVRPKGAYTKHKLN